MTFQSQPAPLLEFRSDGTTATTALELPMPIPRTVRIVKYFTIFSAAALFGLVASSALPLIRATRFDFQFDWAAGTAVLALLASGPSPMQIVRYITIFSAAASFGPAVSVVAPIAATDASCLAWILDLTGRQAPRRSCSADRHQAPCKSRGISRFSRQRRFF